MFISHLNSGKVIEQGKKVGCSTGLLHDLKSYFSHLIPRDISIVWNHGKHLVISAVLTGVAMHIISNKMEQFSYNIIQESLEGGNYHINCGRKIGNNNLAKYCMWQSIEGVNFWRLYAYQTFGNNKLVNYLCSTFKDKSCLC